MRFLPALTATVLAAVGAIATSELPAAGASRLEQLVILLRPPEIDELTREALARITGELAAARFRVIIFPLEAGADPIEQVETVGRDLDPVAAFALVRGADESAGNVGLWISDRLARRTTIQRMHVQDGDLSRAAEVLAVESVELIRVSMADLWPRPAPPSLAQAEPPAGAGPRQLGVAVGMGVLQSFSSAGPLWAPVASLCYGRPGGLAIMIAGSGFGPGVDLADSAGGARVQRETGWLGVVRTFRPGRLLQPGISLAAGADRLRAEGSAVDPTRAHTLTSWSALLAAGAGLAATVLPHLALVLDAEAMVFWPPVVVRIADQEAGRFDRPSVLVDVGVRASF